MSNCKDCFTNCGDNGPISDRCVKYTGEEIPLLGICTGDSLSLVEESIIFKLLDVLDGTGITPNAVTLENCEYLKTLFGSQDKTLNNLLQLLIDSQCSLKELVDDLTPGSYSFYTSCLTGLPTSPTRDDILQATINQLCVLKAKVDAIPSTYVQQSDLQTLVNSYIQTYLSSNPSTPTNSNYYLNMVPYTAMAYFGPLSNFDNTGKGITSAGFNKIYICNGLNGTQDMRGRTIAGAVRNVPGGALDAEVDPTNPLNITNVNYSVNDRFGTNFHKLTQSQNGPHTHGVSDPGHQHSIALWSNDSKGGDQQQTAYLDGSGGSVPTSLITIPSTTGISVNSSGAGDGHENRQPTIAGVWIIYIP